MPGKKAARRRRTFLNAGCGTADPSRLPRMFATWDEIRVDVDPSVEPDVVADISDLSAIPSGSVDAVWSAHCLEHLFAHQVPAAFSEFRRVLRHDGFACIIVPDLQQVSHWIGEDRLHETIYQSQAGPVTAHDMLWGYRPAIAKGNFGMAHRCGFTPTLLLDYLNAAGFAEIVLRRRSSKLELSGLALQQPSSTALERERRMAKLGLDA